MSGKLFAFNVSKKVENADGETSNQWVGDRTARADSFCELCYCTSGQGYGLQCIQDTLYNCYLYGSTGYYICDAYPV